MLLHLQTHHGALEPSAISIAANLGYTFDSGWRPFGTVGLAQMSIDVPFAKDEDETALRLGAGVEYTPASLEHLNFRVAYEVDTFSIDTGFPDYDVTFQLGSLLRRCYLQILITNTLLARKQKGDLMSPFSISACFRSLLLIWLLSTSIDIWPIMVPYSNQ